MIVCIVTPHTGSIVSFREDLVRTLAAKGHETWVVGNECEEIWADYMASLGAAYVSYPLSRTGTSLREDLRTLYALERVFREIKPDVVFNFFAKPNIYGAVAAHRAGVPHVYDSVEGLGSVLSPQKTAKGRMLRRLLMVEYRHALRHVDKCFFVNRDNLTFFVGSGLLPCEKARLVNGVGVNLEKYPYTEVPDGRTAFLYCGRLIREKGIEIFLDAARMLKRRGLDADFLVVGGLDSNPSSVTLDELQEYIDDGSVLYCGAVDDVVPYFQRCLVYSSPSYGEGLPKTGMEALSIGRGLVMTDCAGNRDLVETGSDGNGMLVPCGDVHAFANALEYCAMHREICAEWGKRSRELAEAKYDVHEVNEHLVKELGLLV